MLCRKGHTVHIISVLIFQYPCRHSGIRAAGESMSPDEIEAARVKDTASKSASRKHNYFVLIVQYPCRHSAILRREYVTG